MFITYLIEFLVFIVTVECTTTTTTEKDERPVVSLSRKNMNFLYKVSWDCHTATGVSPIILYKIQQGKFKRGPAENVKQFILCVLIKTNLANRKGVVKKDRLLKIFKDHEEDLEDIEAIIDACARIPGESPADTAYNFCVCFQTNSPVIGTLIGFD